jgi:ABC-2 type transport system ATP-binding protein
MSNAVFEVVNARVSYGRSGILHDANIKLERGTWTALVGPNASGKTTLLRCAGGYIKPAAGDVLIKGQSLYNGAVRPGELPGYASAPEALPAFLSGRQCLEVYAAARGLPGVSGQTLELADVLGFQVFLDSLVRSYSLGTRQKLSLLLALSGSPSVVLLDEVFNGLDPASSLALKLHLGKRVREEGVAILLATHSLDIVARHCDQMVLLVGGRIVRRWNTGQMHDLKDITLLEQALADAMRQPSG